MDIFEAEKILITNKLLWDILLESELNKTGVDLLEMDSKLLAKIEELTLYLIKNKKKLLS